MNNKTGVLTTTATKNNIIWSSTKVIATPFISLNNLERTINRKIS